MDVLISIIVPVYNVERYLNKCVESILSQTYNKLEVILVDDGSTDNSGNLCDNWANIDNRIKVLHKQNGGLSDARNIGLELATGEYICFFDSDDWFEPDIIKSAYDIIVKTKSDVVIWGFYKDFIDQKENLYHTDVIQLPDNVVNKSDGSYSCLLNDNALALIGYAWNKMYKSSVIYNSTFKFEKGISLVEDILFNAPLLAQVNTFCFMNKVGSHYMQRSRETLGAKFYPNYFELKIAAYEARRNLLAQCGASDSEIENAMADSCFSAVKSSCRMVCQCKRLSKDEKKEYMKKICAEPIARKIINSYKATGKNILFKFIFKFKQYWILGVMYK